MRGKVVEVTFLVRTRKWTATAALVVGSLAGLAVSTATAQATTYPVLVNPSANISPTPNFLASGECVGTNGRYTCPNPCVSAGVTWPTFDNGPSCGAYVFSAIDNARAQLGEPALVLPSNWYGLSVDQQLFVIADMERVSLGYPAYLGLNSALSSEAQSAATLNQDPGPAAGFAIGESPNGSQGLGGAWSDGSNVLMADFGWMYDDGWGGSAATTFNLDCGSATDPGCWGHREELLGGSPQAGDGVGLGCTTCEMGTGYAVVKGQSSYVDLLEMPAGAPPTMTFTWASELPFFAAGLPYVPTPSTPTTTLAPTVTPTTSPVRVTAQPELTVKVLVFNPTTEKIRWSSRAATPLTKLTLVTYRTSACTVQWRVASFAVKRRALSGVVTVSGRADFPTTATYSTRIIATGRGVDDASSCVVLGRS